MDTGQWDVMNDKTSNMCSLATGSHGRFDRTDAHGRVKDGGMEEKVLRRSLRDNCGCASLKM